MAEELLPRPRVSGISDSTFTVNGCRSGTNSKAVFTIKFSSSCGIF